MVKLRLARFGKKGQPSYRLVAISARSKRNGRALEYLGHYDPKAKPSVFEYDKERVKYWLSVGAQPSNTVRSFLAKDKLVDPLEKKFTKKPGRKATERAKAQPKGDKTKPEKTKEAKPKVEEKASKSDKPEPKADNVKKTEKKAPEADKEKQAEDKKTEKKDIKDAKEKDQKTSDDKEKSTDKK